MKTTTISSIALAATLWALLLESATAFYNPSTGRWLSRDPSADRHSPDPGSPQVDTWSDFAGSDGSDQPETAASPYTPANLRPAYRYVDSNPIGQIDPKGEDIYLQRGNGTWTPNQWLHLGVCVDTWECRRGTWTKSGKECYSFGVSSIWLIPPSNQWLGWTVPNPGGAMVGTIYMQDYIDGRVIAQIPTTVHQDLTWSTYMLLRRVGLGDTYLLGVLDCRLYSHLEYRAAPLHMGPP